MGLVPGSYVIDVCFVSSRFIRPVVLRIRIWFVWFWAGCTDPYQIEMLEMQVEARLVRQTQGLSSSSGTSGGEDDDHLKSRSMNIAAEFKSWGRLFGRKFIDRTWIGILMMVFQRECRMNIPALFLALPPGDPVLSCEPRGIGIPETNGVPYALPAVFLTPHLQPECPLSDAPLTFFRFF